VPHKSKRALHVQPHFVVAAHEADLDHVERAPDVHEPDPAQVGDRRRQLSL
jgi:hypothetical protein